MTARAVTAVRAAVSSGQEADGVLRAAVTALVAEPGVAWAGIALLEGDQLSLGPWAGVPEEDRRRSVPVRYRDETIAELWVDGDAGPDLLADVADLVAEHCLVGWDTGGEPWTAG